MLSFFNNNCKDNAKLKILENIFNFFLRFFFDNLFSKINERFLSMTLQNYRLSIYKKNILQYFFINY